MSTGLKRFLPLVFCAVGVACAGAETKTASPARPDEPGKTVYLASHGWHAGIVIRRADIPDGVWPEHKDLPDSVYLEVGWGDSDYYRTPDPHWGITFKAGLLPTASVLHIVGFSSSVPAYFPNSEIIEIRLSAPGFAALCHYIAASYFKDPAGNSVALGLGLYGGSRFYQSHETYHLFNNCNAWTDRALQTAGCPLKPASVFTVANLMARARTCGKVIHSQPSDYTGEAN
ncbi:MAG: DUF2459 domain-containing protein [Thiogranum sp.]